MPAKDNGNGEIFMTYIYAVTTGKTASALSQSTSFFRYNTVEGVLVLSLATGSSCRTRQDCRCSPAVEI